MPEAEIPQSLAAGVVGVARLLANCERPWWIIGSSAVALHGAAAGPIADIDVVIAPEDFTSLESAGAIQSIDDRTRDHFNSDHFGRAEIAGMTVELFAGLKVKSHGQWHLVAFDRADTIEIGGKAVTIPTRADLVALLELFARPKDLARADALRSI